MPILRDAATTTLKVSIPVIGGAITSLLHSNALYYIELQKANSNAAEIGYQEFMNSNSTYNNPGNYGTPGTGINGIQALAFLPIAFTLLCSYVAGRLSTINEFNPKAAKLTAACCFALVCITASILYWKVGEFAIQTAKFNQDNIFQGYLSGWSTGCFRYPKLHPMCPNNNINNTLSSLPSDGYPDPGAPALGSMIICFTAALSFLIGAYDSFQNNKNDYEPLTP